MTPWPKPGSPDYTTVYIILHTVHNTRVGILSYENICFFLPSDHFCCILYNIQYILYVRAVSNYIFCTYINITTVFVLASHYDIEHWSLRTESHKHDACARAQQYNSYSYTVYRLHNLIYLYIGTPGWQMCVCNNIGLKFTYGFVGGRSRWVEINYCNNLQ